MKRLCILCFAVMSVAACAGNPPQWWNPGNRYSQQEQTASQQATPAARPATTVATEETLDPLPDNSYEEEAITPLPQEDDTPLTQPEAEPALADTLPAPSVLE